MPLDFQTAQEYFQDGLLRGFEILTTAQHGINLYGKISVMLGDCPDRKDQMIGINGGKLSLGNPGLDYLGFFVHQLTQWPFQEFLYHGCAMKNFIGKEP